MHWETVIRKFLHCLLFQLFSTISSFMLVIHKVLCAASFSLPLNYKCWQKLTCNGRNIKKTLLELIDLLKEKLIPGLSKKHVYILQLSLSAFPLKLDELPYKRCNKVQCTALYVSTYMNMATVISEYFRTPIFMISF